MTADSALDDLARRHCILDRYHDLAGAERVTSVGSKRALLRAVGVDVDSDASVRGALELEVAREAERLHPGTKVIDAGTSWEICLPGDCTWHLSIEGQTGVQEGRSEAGTTRMNALPAGVHELRLQAGSKVDRVILIAAPKAAPSVQCMTGQDRIWGITAALYGVRSDRNLGIGDFEDLAALAETMGARGACFLGINPIHALGWADQTTASPYSPSHRGFLNSLHIAADTIPGLDNSARARALLEKHREAASIGQKTDLIKYPKVSTDVRTLLEKLFADARAHSAIVPAPQQTEDSAVLRTFALYEALSEVHGPDWRKWPEGLRSPESADVKSASRNLSERIEFHIWLQTVANWQLEQSAGRAVSAGLATGLYLDIAVGSRRGGAESWCDKTSFARGVSLGAPPDRLSPEGQNWNLAGFSPRGLIRSGFSGFRQILRANMAHAGVVRLDHVLGLNRSFWVPDDGSPGAYIAQPLPELLALIAVEADRARTIVIGEDLGLVPEGFRLATEERGLYGYSVLQFEKDGGGDFRHSDDLRQQSMTCFGTHDTPTLAGFAQARDIDWWRKVGWTDDATSASARNSRAAEVRALKNLGEGDLFQSVHEAMARSPAAIVSVQLDDIAEEVEAQNLPGTVDEHPNWRRKLSVPIEDVADLPKLQQAEEIMRARGRCRWEPESTEGLT